MLESEPEVERTALRTCGEMVLHPSVDVVDSSKLGTLMDCPRRFFYEHVLGWRVDKFGEDFHLVFGEAWHRAIEVLSHIGFDDEALMRAFTVFQEYYAQHFDVDAEMHKNKTLANVLRGLALYSGLYKHSGFKTLYTEVSGVVPVSDTRSIHFRLDNISEKDGQVYVLDHKTGSTFSRSWYDQWSTSNQMSCYTHAAYCHFDPSTVWGVRIRGILFQQQKLAEKDLVEVPVHKTMEMMQAWLVNVNRWFDVIDQEFDKLASATANDDVMAAFPLNTQSCTKYFGCPFITFCTAWANPLRRCGVPPSDFKVAHWDPRDRDKDATVRVQDGKWIPVKENI